MNNEIITNGKIYKLESIWRNNKNDKSKDMHGKLFPFPEIGTPWSGKDQFVEKLIEVQDYLDNNSKNIDLDEKKCLDCLLCKSKCVVTKRYTIGNYLWDDGLFHYVEKHDIKPTEDFINKIFNFEVSSDVPIRLMGRVKSKNDVSYLKLDKNQIMILDALMKHGGYNKKYYDTIKRNVTRYSEHAGFFDIRGKMIHNIIVSGNTLRIDRGDEEIFLPKNTPDAYDYEYIFHTHPPTPKPGGRASEGILYEFPSIGDMLHFVDHFNDGSTIGSLVMTAEGLYNIRKSDYTKKAIDIDEDQFYDDIRKVLRDAQEKALAKYGSTFNTYKFYSQIAQDISFIELINQKLNKYHLAIDFYPRIKDFRGSWIIDTIYIPIYK
jgi:hypothetical protein